jgi:transcription initiation factor TFIID subunit 5
MVRYNWIYCPVFVIYLNLFRVFLSLILYPAARSFFHTFREDHEVMHSRDLQKLEGVLSPSHLEEMELARSLRQNKFKIKLCEYSYELLLQYIQKTQALVVLGVINEHITFEVSPGQPLLISDDADVVALIGTSKDLAKQINQKEVHWGVCYASARLLST